MSGLTEDQMYEFQETFSLFETRGDGKIDASRLGDVLRALGLNPTEAEVRKLIAEVTQTGQNQIQFQQFVPLYQAVAKRKDTTSVEDFIQGFSVFDKDSNGTISSAELRHLLTTLGERLTDEEVELLVGPHEDQHGNVNYEEFVKQILSAAH